MSLELFKVILHIYCLRAIAEREMKKLQHPIQMISKGVQNISSEANFEIRFIFNVRVQLLLKDKKKIQNFSYAKTRLEYHQGTPRQEYSGLDINQRGAQYTF